jgi:hypothetical protein
VTFTANLDMPSVYVFRGIVQEANPRLTTCPSAEVGVRWLSGDGPVRAVSVHLGTWHSLQQGSSGSGGPSGKTHYEEDFYASLGIGFGNRLSLDTTFTAYTSPNDMFQTVRELSVKASATHPLEPYGLVGLELSGAADGTDDGMGTYLELGIAPTLPFGGSSVSVTMPIRVGTSLHNYYQSADGGGAFGYLAAGAGVDVPLRILPRRFGAWHVHGGADVYVFGRSTRVFNLGDGTRVVGRVGVGVGY